MAKKTQRGSGYLTPAEFFNPSDAARQPSSTAPALTSAPAPGWVRPPMAATSVINPEALSTSQKGGAWKATRKMVRKMEGGFAPALMGSFVANAQTAAVPLALYGLYHLTAKKSAAPNAVASKPKGGKRGTRHTRRA